MGTDKAQLLIGGTPLWQRQLQILRELPLEDLWVSAPARPPWCPGNIEVVFDSKPYGSALSGLTAGLGHLRTSHLLVLAIDLPSMTSGHLNKLWNLASPAVGVVPLQTSYFEPLCAIYPAETLSTAEKSLSSGDASLQRFVQTLLQQSQMKIFEIPLEEQSLYLNLNTPADLPKKEEAR
jgi:molybdopterin-guanine dinucleotide biosynthesis protein A